MIKLIGKASAATTSVALPAGINVGDFIIIFAYRAAITAPTLGAGYTSISTQSANSNSFTVGFKRAVGSDTSGTWTNAALIIASVYRGVSAIGGAGSTTNVAAATVTISGIGAFTVSTGSSWVVAYAGSAQTTSMATPANTVLQATQVGTGAMGIFTDTEIGKTSWAQQTPAIGASAVGVGGSFELIMDSNVALQNYMAPKAVDNGNGVLSFGERIR